MTRRVVIGFGNLLMGDDAVGIHVIKHLADIKLPDDVELVDGAVASFEALSDARDADEIVIVDALAGGGKPGDLYQISPDDLGEVAASGHFSLHQFTLTEALHLTKQLGPMPPIVIFGIEPGRVELGLELSAPVAQGAQRVAHLIASYLQGENYA